MGRTVDKNFLEDIFKQYDADGNGSVGLEEFKCAVRRRTKLEQWTASMPTGPLVASCFVSFLLRSYATKKEHNLNLRNDPDPLSSIKDIDEVGLSTVCIGLMDGFRKLICQRINQVKESYAAMSTHNLSTSADCSVGKFAFSMQGGKTSDFYSGLGALVGTNNFTIFLF